MLTYRDGAQSKHTASNTYTQHVVVSAALHSLSTLAVCTQDPPLAQCSVLTLNPVTTTHRDIDIIEVISLSTICSVHRNTINSNEVQSLL